MSPQEKRLTLALVVSVETDDASALADAEASIRRAVACHDQLVAALEGLTPILEAAESNASGNPEWTWVSPRINAARAALAADKGDA